MWWFLQFVFQVIQIKWSYNMINWTYVDIVEVCIIAILGVEIQYTILLNGHILKL